MLLEQIQWFAKQNKLLLFLLEKRFLDPQIPEQMEQLQDSGLLTDLTTLDVIHQHLPGVVNQLPAGMYFPTPMAKALANGELFSETLALRFYYDFIKVDADQNWFLKGKPIEGKVKKLFLENMGYEASIDRYFVEYKVDQRLDKCYLDCEITPLVVIRVEIYEKNKLKVLLNNGQSDWICNAHFKIDSREQCFCETIKYGEALLADQPRFMILQHLQEDGHTLQFGNQIFQLVEVD